MILDMPNQCLDLALLQSYKPTQAVINFQYLIVLLTSQVWSFPKNTYFTYCCLLVLSNMDHTSRLANMIKPIFLNIENWKLKSWFRITVGKTGSYLSTEVKQSVFVIFTWKVIYIVDRSSLATKCNSPILSDGHNGVITIIGSNFWIIAAISCNSERERSTYEAGN
jgi:hypothetical protein